MRPQLQVDHWYLVHDGDGHASIRSYMHDGWSPPEPQPTDAVCELSRADHPDNIALDAEDVVVSQLDQIMIERYCAAAVGRPLVARAIRAAAEMFARANWKEWDPNWSWDPRTDGPIFLNHHAGYLAIAAVWVADMGCSGPEVGSMGEILAVRGQPLERFRPRKWPAEVIPGAVQLDLSERDDHRPTLGSQAS